MTIAQEHLQNLQAANPPFYPKNSSGKDRAAALAEGLLPVLPDTLRDKMDDGTLAVGEIGTVKPEVKTIPLGQRNYVITLNSGQMDFYYAVVRALSGVMSVHVGSTTPENPAAASVHDVVPRVAAAFRNWRDIQQPGFWRGIFGGAGERIAHDTTELGSRVLANTERLATCAELFMLAHEFAHVALDLGIRQGPHPDSEELSADAVGFSFFRRMFTKGGYRDAHAAAAFAVRVTGGLEHAGVRFARDYPPAIERLRHLRDAMANQCPSPAYFDEAANIMVAYCDLMDDIDRALDPKSATSYDSWVAAVGLAAALEEVARGNQPRAAFAGMVERAAGRLPPEGLAAVGRIIRSKYGPGSSSAGYIEPPLRTAMCAVLGQCLWDLPEQHRAHFVSSK